MIITDTVEMLEIAGQQGGIVYPALAHDDKDTANIAKFL